MSGGMVWLMAEAELPPLFPGMGEGPRQQAAQPAPESRKPERAQELWMYREKTLALLRRYMRLSVETGRLPSLLGREFFRTRVRSYHVRSFEDIVIFVHDMEASLEKLDRFAQELIARMVLQEYTEWETARLLRCGLRTVERCFPEAVDQLSGIFLAAGILSPPDLEMGKTCQEGKNDEK